jgi:hypothetical protein
MNRALKLLKEKGAPKMKSFNVQCADYVPRWVMDEARDNTIDDYFTLFNCYCQSDDEKVSKTKKALSQDRPVLINMHLPMSFYGADDVWNGIAEEGEKTYYHAMCVVAYDDNKAGGAFQIMNSWGTKWGKDGYTWVRYADFCKYVNWAFEMYVKKARYPEEIMPKRPTDSVQVIPIRQVPVMHVSGSMRVELSTGETMEQHLVRGTLPIYHVEGEFISGTRSRVYLSNNEPAYVYVIASDQQNNVSKLFPYAENISAALVYSSNNIALPDETHYNEMDYTVGKDYLCVLYAQQELPIDDIISTIKRADGTFPMKLKEALGERLAPEADIKYGNKEVSFEARTPWGKVVPLIMVITHV